MKKIYSSKIIAGVFVALFTGIPSLFAQNLLDDKMAEFVESYKTDPMALTTTFGVKIGDQWWHVHSERVQEGYAVGRNNQYTFHNFGPNNVQLHEGEPEEPTYYFEFADETVFENIYTKKWTATTAAAKSMPSDVVALNLREMDGYPETIGNTAVTYQVLEHFWKKDAVEITTFERDQSLPSHGAAMVALYTMKDKRIAWFSLGQDEAANTDKNLEAGQVPNLFIITKGKGKAILADEEVELTPGMSIFVGPYMKHVLFNPNEEPLEGILVLFGDNSDFAFGNSYLDYVDRYHTFLNNSAPNIHSNN